MMLGYQRHKSPQTYRQIHADLAKYYSTRRNQPGFSEEEQWTNEEWRKYTLAYVYHFLVADPNRHWGEMLTLFVVAMREWWPFANEMIKLLHLDDVHDELSHEQHTSIHLFFQQLQAVESGNLKDAFEMFDKLCSIAGLSSQAKAYALTYRGECHRLVGKWEKAYNDFEEALYYNPNDSWTIGSRGQIQRMLGHYNEALSDLNNAIFLDEKDIWVIIERGETYRLMGRYHEALNDFDFAIAYDNNDAWVIARRGETYRLMGHYHEALADLDQAIELDESAQHIRTQLQTRIEELKQSPTD